MQKSRVKVNDQGRKITFWELERRYQLVVRLKVNKYYMELLCSLSSYINLLNLLNLYGLCSRLLAPGRFQTSSTWFRPLINSDLKGSACTRACIYPIVWSVGHDPTALRRVACFVAIRPLLDKLLDLNCLVGRSRSVNRWFDQMMLLISFLQSFSWAVQDGIIPLNDHASTLDLYQDHLCTSRDHLDKPLDLFLLRSLPASIMLQGSSAGVTAVTLLQGDLLYYRDHSTTGRSRRSNRKSMDKLMLTSW